MPTAVFISISRLARSKGLHLTKDVFLGGCRKKENAAGGWEVAKVGFVRD
ncbi:hypothetical protein R1T40_22085 (plasmid) [Tritonibacter scottomollicae]|uniref:Uncharacterized protein n=1 Tax=Tritonibacter scottomollicae TaxID=483013 RepID=A0ABZ0HPN0_TRISK|nr:hypothetical protein R1T40_22085 [Tritonibacter scottomollicae]